ncbi:MAG: 3-deoxy-D-manno-octulosonic acid transferase [Acidobacteriota bacterium]
MRVPETWSFTAARWGYTLLHTLVLPLYPVRSRLRPGHPTVLTPRLGGANSFAGLPPIPPEGSWWLHAVSVGEVNAVRPLAEALSRLVPGPLIVSTITPSGQETARKNLGAFAHTLYFPVDLPGVCRRYFRALRPRLILLAETEIWPNFIRAAKRQGIPVVVVNGRISDRSFGRYRRMRSLFLPVFARLDRVCAQSRLDRERFIELGVPPEAVHLVGNLKFDYVPRPEPRHAALNERVQRLWSEKGGDLILLAGSTKPGEEALLVGIFRRLREAVPRLRLILAPRHPHRAEEVCRLVEEAGLAVLRRSTWEERTPEVPPDVLILDTIGELAHLYAVADVVFIGGSLVPEGGQNVIEPAAYGKPVLFGPHMENFREVAAAFVDEYAAIQVADAAELEERLRTLFADAHARRWLGRNARQVIRRNQGALERTLRILRPYLGVEAEPAQQPPAAAAAEEELNDEPTVARTVER